MGVDSVEVTKAYGDSINDYNLLNLRILYYQLFSPKCTMAVYGNKTCKGYVDNGSKNRSNTS